MASVGDAADRWLRGRQRAAGGDQVAPNTPPMGVFVESLIASLIPREEFNRAVQLAKALGEQQIRMALESLQRKDGR